jgi:hypothetical protein
MGGNEMKCDELKAINAYQLTTNTEDSDVYIHNDEFGCGGDLVECYLKSEVDEAIAELKAKLESVQASAYADSVDAGMRERRLRRALWLARAEWARSSALSYHLIEDHPDKDAAETYKRKANKWEKVKDKCLKKAELYK